MAEERAVHPTDDAFVSSIPTTVDTRKREFAQMLKVKLEQGYRIESQGDSEAVLFRRSRRNWFGLFARRGPGGGQIISVDDQRAATTRQLSRNET